MYQPPTMLTHDDRLTVAEKARDDRRNTLVDLESILTDLQAAYATAELVNGMDHIAAEIDKLGGVVRERLVRAECGEWS